MPGPADSEKALLDSNSCRKEKTEKTVKSEKTWIVQRLAPLREQRADGSLDVPSRGGTAKSAWDPPNLAGYLHQGPELKEENYLQEQSMQRGPAPRLGHSVQHVIDTVRATRARRAREARSTVSSASSEAKDRAGSPLRGSPKSPYGRPRSPSPRRSTLLDQLLQQHVLEESSLRTGHGSHGYLPDPADPTPDNLSIPVLQRSRGMAHLVGRPLEVVQEEYAEAFSDSDFCSSRRSRRPASTPRVADLPAKVKWETLLATREARAPPSAEPATYLLKDRLKPGCQISSSILSARFSEPMDSDASDFMLWECTWCRTALPAHFQRSDGFIHCPSCHRSFDGKKARMSFFGGANGIAKC